MNIYKFHLYLKYIPLKRLNTSTRRLRFFPGHRVFGNCYEKIASKRPSKRDRNFDQIHARKSKNACSLSNCILILTPGGATPTYDEPVDTASEPDMNSPIVLGFRKFRKAFFSKIFLKIFHSP